MDLSNIILGGGGQGKQLARTTPDQVTGLQAVSSEEGILLSVDQPTEESYEYLKDYWVTFKLASEGEIQHPYDGEYIIFAKPTYTGNFEFLIPNAELIMNETYNIRIFPRNQYSQFQTALDGSTATVNTGVKTMTAVIDLNNSDPSTSVTYADDAVNMTPGSNDWDEFFGIYPCLFKNGAEAGKLNPNDFTKLADGGSADITSGDVGDVMIAFPRRGIKITTSGTTLTVSMTNEQNKEGFQYYAHQRGTKQKDIFYIGSYLGFVSGDSKLRSLSGKTPTGNMVFSAFRERARANGSGYELFSFYQLLFLQSLFILKYKSLNSQTALGKGITSSSAVQNTGGTNTEGMNYGDQTGTTHMKVFGIEDLWGNAYVWLDGIRVDSGNFRASYDPDQFNDGGTGYTSIGLGNISGYVNKVLGTNESGFLGNVAAGSATTYFADRQVSSGNGCIKCSGSYSQGTEVGIFSLFYDSQTNIRPFYCSRLMYL